MQQTTKKGITKAFNKNARLYDRWITFFERYLADGARARAVSIAHGSVVEIGVASGLNLPLYGARVQHVTAFDLSEKMLAIARKRIAEKRIDRVELHHGDAQTLDLPPESADTFISTFTFCTIPDPLAASREAYRLRAIEPLIRVSAEHITRDPVPYLTGACFTITEVRRGGPGDIVFRILAHKHDAC